jgi:hypothetical protein
MSGIATGLQQVGNAQATIGLYISPIIAIIFCCIGWFLIKASQQPVTPAPASPTPQPPNQPPPMGIGIFFIVCGFLIPLIAYGFYKLTMASPGFATLEGAGTALNLVKGI